MAPSSHLPEPIRHIVPNSPVMPPGIRHFSSMQGDKHVSWSTFLEIVIAVVTIIVEAEE